MSKLVLPRQDDEGNYYISYSQIKGWLAEVGFNTNMMGRFEYIREYFLGEKFPDSGYSAFGTEVEGYICEREFSQNFKDEEKKTLDKIVPLGEFQKEIKIQFDGFYLKGYIDDAKKVHKRYKKIRDYKTASEKSKQQYFEDDYKQLDIYSLAILKETKSLPEESEVFIVGRKGNTWGKGKMYTGELEGKRGRDALFVDDWTETVPKEVSMERVKAVEKLIIETAQEISKYYVTFLELNKIK